MAINRSLFKEEITKLISIDQKRKIEEMNVLFHAFDTRRRMWEEIERNFDEFGKITIDDYVRYPTGYSLS